MTNDEEKQIDYSGSNIIPSKTDHQISDGQKRYGTLLSDSESNYPKPKTMFYVSFNYASGYKDVDKDEIASKMLSKYVTEVTKPNVKFSTKKMNQYNRIKYVYENVEYGDLKITFMDTKNSNLEQILFKFLKHVDKDFYHHKDVYNNYAQNSVASYGNQWGLHARSNERLFESITIAEMHFDRLMVYTIQNPLISDINFGDNKIGDYSPNKITVTFKVEGITNDITIDKNSTEYKDVVGKLFTSVGGENMVHFLEKIWNPGNGVNKTNEDIYSVLSEIDHGESFRKQQVDRTNDILKETRINNLRKIYAESVKENNERESSQGYTWRIDPYTGRKILVNTNSANKFNTRNGILIETDLFKF